MKEQIAQLLRSAGIVASNVVVLGSFVHVDSSKSHDDKLQHVFTAAGFRIIKAEDCQHMDGYKGYRLSAKLA